MYLVALSPFQVYLFTAFVTLPLRAAWSSPFVLKWTKVLLSLNSLPCYLRVFQICQVSPLLGPL